MKHFVAFGNFWVYSDTVSAVFLVPSERHSLVVVLRSFRVSGLHFWCEPSDDSAGCDRARPLCDDDRSLLFLPTDIHFFFFCDLTDPIVSLATSSRTVLVPFQRSSVVTSFCAASNAVNLLVTSAANCTALSSLSSSRFRGRMLFCLCLLPNLTFSVATSNWWSVSQSAPGSFHLAVEKPYSSCTRHAFSSSQASRCHKNHHQQVKSQECLFVSKYHVQKLAWNPSRSERIHDGESSTPYSSSDRSDSSLCSVPLNDSVSPVRSSSSSGEGLCTSDIHSCSHIMITSYNGPLHRQILVATGLDRTP